MKLVYLWIYKYKGEYLDKIGFHFSNELAVTVRYKGVKREKSSTIYGEIEVDKVFVDLKIKKSKEKAVPKSLYGDHILGMTAVVGKNGAGKTALLHAVMQSDNMQPDITGERAPFLAIYYDEEKKEFQIDKYLVEIEKTERDESIVLKNENSSCIMRKCYVTNVFNWTELVQKGEELIVGEGSVLKKSIAPAELMGSCAEKERKSFGYRTHDNNYLVNIQHYAGKEIQSELLAYSRKQQKLFLQFAVNAPDKFRNDLSILDRYQIGLREFREDITNIEYYYSGNEDLMAVPSKNFKLLGAYDQAQVETKLYYNILSYKLSQRKDEITLWDKLYVLLLAEVYLSFCGSNGEFYKYLQKKFIDMQEVRIDEAFLDEIKKELEKGEIKKSPWCKQIFEAIEELKNRAKRNWMLYTDYKYEEKKEDGFLAWFLKKLDEKNSFVARNVYVLPQPGSSGEEGFVNLFSYIDDAVSKMDKEMEEIVKEQKEHEKKKTDIILLIDEIDCYFHPAWQQKAMHYVLEWLNGLYEYCNFQIVVSSHSPIILSDFVRKQVIKLKKQNGKCAIYEDDKETFGANIAHLYYDSFFMENGQIGEFAKERILEAINYVQNPNHPDYQKDSEKIRYIIAHIGDEYMKKKIGLEFLMKNGKMRSIINDFLNYQLENEPLLSEEESELEP